MKLLCSIFRISLYTGVMFTAQSSGSDIVVTPDSCDVITSASVYFVVREPDLGYMRVTLSEYWGMYCLYIDEIRYDDIEGLPGIISSYRFDSEILCDALGFDYIYRLEFIEWIDRRTIEISFNRTESFILQRIGNGEFLLQYNGSEQVME